MSDAETDSFVNPAGIKGIGELRNLGTNAAAANAVFHATGKRIRTLPIRLENLIQRLRIRFSYQLIKDWAVTP